MTLLDLLISPAYAQAADAGRRGRPRRHVVPVPDRPDRRHVLPDDPPADEARRRNTARCSTSSANGDEVITNGGIAGAVREIGDSFITVEIADNVRVRVQKGAIATVLPKGTLKSA